MPHRSVLVALFVATGLLSAPIRADDPPPKDDEPKLVATPNTGYGAEPGDKAEIYEQDTPACTTQFVLGEFLKFSEARDAVGMESLVKRKFVNLVPAGTSILVVQTHFTPVEVSGSMSGAEFARRQQAAILGSSRAEKPRDAVEVRILDGPFKDQLRFVPVEKVALLKPAPVPRSVPKKAAPKPVDPEVRAATLLKSASNLAKAGKRDVALKNYREIVRDYPTTKAAKDAEKAINALGQK